jgi:hypothetical protein
MWSEGHIRSLASSLGEWECLVGDLRGFIKRLVSTLKPVNKSVLQEKGMSHSTTPSYLSSVDSFSPSQSYASISPISRFDTYP